MTSVILEVMLPVFGAILIGFLAARSGLVAGSTATAMNGFVYYIAFPALLFVSLASSSTSDIMHTGFLAVWTAGIGYTYVLSLLFAVLEASVHYLKWVYGP